MFRIGPRVATTTLLALLAGVVGAQDASFNGHEYRIGAGDVLAVDGFQHEEITGEFPVEGSGSMTFPLLGDVAVMGLTTYEVSRLLEELLEKDFYVDVQLQVEVKEYRSQPVTVLGEVARPGTYYLRGETTLLQILTDAGGIKSTSGPALELRRAVIQDGEEVRRVITFSTSKLLTGEEGGEVKVRMGDVISVSARQLYFIHGEVARPGQYEISPGMTLMQAISQAGGLGKFASQTIEVHRESDGDKTILDFDLAHIRKGKTPDPPISPGDVVIVKRRFF